MKFVIYYFVTALIMCLILNIALHVDKNHEIEKICNDSKVSIKGFMVFVTLFGFVTLPIVIWSCFKNCFKE